MSLPGGGKWFTDDRLGFHRPPVSAIDLHAGLVSTHRVGAIDLLLSDRRRQLNADGLRRGDDFLHQFSD